MAIKAAKHNLIVSTDFGCRMDHQWLESIVSPFKDKSVKIVGGAHAIKEDEQVTLAAKAAYIIVDGYKSDVLAEHALPTSRSIAYTKDVFEKIGGYCEWLTLAADDTVFAKEIIANGYNIFRVKDPYIYWDRHDSAKGFIKEAGRYGLGDGEAANVNSRHFNFLLIKLALRYLLVALFILIIFVKGSNSRFLFLLPFLYGFRPYQVILKNWLKYRSPKYSYKVLLYAFYLYERVTYSYLLSYLIGYFRSTPYQKQQMRLLKVRLSK
jgi:cellulose synthase/poly-beta-1,6-N-acetylglucosamine synthase-like glycosyltransferase